METDAALDLLENGVMEAARYLSGRFSARPHGANARELVSEAAGESRRILRAAIGNQMPALFDEHPGNEALRGSGPDFLLIDPLNGGSLSHRFLGEQGGQVGFGPLAGIIKEGRLEACSFYHLPRGGLYSAVRGGGTWLLSCPVNESARRPPLDQRRRLAIGAPRELAESGLLFLPGKSGDLAAAAHLKRNHLVENAYCFGGFANDCIRLTHDQEQILLQYEVPPAGFCAALLAHEAGLGVVADPLGRRLGLGQWTVAESNPVLICHVSLQESLLSLLNGSR